MDKEERGGKWGNSRKEEGEMGEKDGEMLKLLGRREKGELYEKRRKEEM